MSRWFKGIVFGTLCLILIAAWPASLSAQPAQKEQKTAPEVEIEKLRLEAEQRARAEAEQKTWETRIFEVKYADLNELQRVLLIFQAQMNMSSSLRVLSVRAPKEVMPLIADAIKRLDVPQTPAPRTNVELTAYVLSASNEGSGDSIPNSLQPVVKQLRTLFSYKNFRLIDTLVLQGADGRDISSSGVLPESAFTKAGGPTVYNLWGSLRMRTADGKEPVLRIERFRFNLRVALPTGPFSQAPAKSQEDGKPVVQSYNYFDHGIGTDVEVPAGQHVVVGKTTLGDSSLILVLTAKFHN